MAEAPASKPKTAGPAKVAPKAQPAAKAAPKPAARPAARPTPGRRPAPGAPTARRGPNPYDVVLHPIVTEKTMFNMDRNNSLEFLVHVTASKPEIRRAIEELFACKLAKVSTRIGKDGKRATVRFAEGYSAEDIGMRIGVF